MAMDSAHRKMNCQSLLSNLVPYMFFLLSVLNSARGDTASDVQTCYKFAVQLNETLPIYTNNLELKRRSVELGYKTLVCLDEVIKQYDQGKEVDPAVAGKCASIIEESQSTGLTYGGQELGAATRAPLLVVPDLSTLSALRNLKGEN